MTYIIGFIVLYFAFKIGSSILLGATEISGGLIELLMSSILGRVMIFSIILLIVSKISSRPLPFMSIFINLSIFAIVISILGLAYIVIFPTQRRD